VTTEKNFKIHKAEKLPDSEALIEGEITLEFLNVCRKDALKHLQEHASLPGFRKGHVPEDVLIKSVGEMGVLEEAAEVALGKEYGHIVEESKLRPITRPHISITKLAPGIPLSFKIQLILEPEFELPDYKKIATESLEEKVSDEKELNKDQKRMKMLAALTKATEINFPKKFVEGEAAHMLSHFKADLTKAGIEWNKYLEQVKKTEEEILNELKTDVSSRIKPELILHKIAEKENLKTYGEVFEFLEKK